MISCSVRLIIRIRRKSVKIGSCSAINGRKESEQRNGRDEHGHGCYVIMSRRKQVNSSIYLYT